MNEKREIQEIVLKARPKGMPALSDFELRKTPLADLKENEVLVKTTYLTVDPYMRGRMNDKPSYIPPFQVGQPLTGGAVGEVIESKNPKFQKGDIVYGFLSWSNYSIAEGATLRKLDTKLAPPSSALGVLGMPGMTAYFGLFEIGKPQKGETVVVSGSAGAVGTLVGQMAKLKGCRVVGIAGSQEKCDYLIKELGFDAAINYKVGHLKEALTKVCPKGVDVYFDNVGGDISDEVIKLINKHARVVLCGQISMYNLDKPDVGPRNWWLLLTRSSLAQGFIVSDYTDRFPEGISQLSEWLKSGKLKYRESIVNGLENAPKAFLGLFSGDNIGKQLVKL
jgi:NADPH-dependent curcumin reductase CurA